MMMSANHYKNNTEGIKITYPSVTKTVLIGKQSVWETPVAAAKDSGLLVEEISDNFSREIIQSAGLGAIELQAINPGIVDIGHSIAGEFVHGRLLEGIFGAVAHVETTGDWKHTFTISNTPPSYTIESGNNLSTDTTLTSAGMLVESAEFSIELNNTLRLKVDFKGKTTASTASAQAAIISTLPPFPHVLVNMDINGSTVAEIQSATLTITKTVERSGGLGTSLYQQGHATTIIFEMSATLGFQDKTQQELWLGGAAPDADDITRYDLKIEADNGVALGSGQRNLTLELESSIGATFDEVATIGSLVFFDVTYQGTLKTATNVDNISSSAF